MEGLFALAFILIPAVIGLTAFVFWLSMLVHCLKNESPNKLVWVLLIIFIPLLGAVLYRVIEYKKVPAAGIQPAV